MAQGKAFTIEQRELIIRSLKPYLEMGFSRNKSCQMIGLAPTTLSDWVVDNEALRMELQSWENVVNTIAVQNIVSAIRKESELDDDIRKENSWKWAERRLKEDFSLRNELTGADGKDLPTPIMNLDVLSNDSDKTNSETEPED